MDMYVSKTCVLVQKISQKTSHDSLMADDQNIPLSLQLHNDWLQALNQILIRLQGEKKEHKRFGNYYFFPTKIRSEFDFFKFKLRIIIV